VKGYEGHYKVSNLGNVFSVRRNQVLKIDNSNPNGYKRVTLSLNGITKRVQVHRLVLENFVPNPLNKPFCNHIDHNPSNNNVTNLEWVNQSENMQHSVKAGRQVKVQTNITKLAAIANKQATEDTYQKLIGKSLNGRTLISYKRVPRKQGDTRIMGTFTCDNCGCIIERELSSVLLQINRVKPLYCRSCSMSSKGKDIV
jgi:hypothetical protein